MPSAISASSAIAAMKVLAPDLARRPREVQRFVREAQITAQLDHPNIAPVYEIGTDRRGTATSR